MAPDQPDYAIFFLKKTSMLFYYLIKSPVTGLYVLSPLYCLFHISTHAIYALLKCTEIIQVWRLRADMEEIILVKWQAPCNMLM